MAKLMYALWGSGLDDAVRSVPFRESLSAAGAEHLQVNVGGRPEFADAMALTTFAEPVDAIVSVWTDGDPASIVEVLAGVAARVLGWEVTERRPLEPPPVTDGEAADAMANVAFLRRPESLTRTTWLTRWLDDHTPIAMATQATSGYIQNIVERPLTDDTPRVDAIVEELFPIAGATDPHAFYGSGGDDAELRRRMTALIDSVVRIGAHENIDVVPTRRHLYALR